MKTLTKFLSLLLAVCCALAMSVTAFALVDVSPFSDVSENDWFYSPVKEANDRGFMQGVGDRKFAPADNMSRAMAVTVLRRVFKGVQAPEGMNSFNDVPKGKWYSDAICWAAALGIVNGRGNGEFDPHADVTRAELCVMVDRTLEAAGYSFSTGVGEQNESMTCFEDIYDIPDYAIAAMAKLYHAGVITGTDKGTIEPKSAVSRAEAAAIICRTFSHMVKKPSLLSKYGLSAEVCIWEDRMPTFTPTGRLGDRFNMTLTLRCDGDFDTSLEIGAFVTILGRGESVRAELTDKSVDGNKCILRYEYEDALMLGLLGFEEDEIVPVFVDLTINGQTESITYYPSVEVTW